MELRQREMEIRTFRLVTQQPPEQITNDNTTLSHHNKHHPQQGRYKIPETPGSMISWSLCSFRQLIIIQVGLLVSQHLKLRYSSVHLIERTLRINNSSSTPQTELCAVGLAAKHTSPQHTVTVLLQTLKLLQKHLNILILWTIYS